MKCYDEALAYDLDKRYVDAIQAYERSITLNERHLDAYKNVAFLYWRSAAEFTFRDEYNIPDEIGQLGEKRFKTILEAASAIVGDDVELRFWELYFARRLVYSEINEQDILDLVGKNKASNHVPYFYLYLIDRKKYKNQRDSLLMECTKMPTAKNLYIISLIKD